MKNPVFTKALIRLLLSLPFHLLLFCLPLISGMLSWSRLYAPNWADTLSFLADNTALIENCAAFVLMCLQYPLYLRGFANLRRRLPGVNTLLAVSTLSAFLLGALPLILDKLSVFFLSNPLYASTMSALLAFDAIGLPISTWLACGRLLSAFPIVCVPMPPYC